MKKNFILLTFLLGFIVIIFSSYSSGVSCTTSNCTASGCHKAQPGSALLLLWDVTTGSLVTSPLKYTINHSYRLLMRFTPSAGDSTAHTSRAYGFFLSTISKNPSGAIRVSPTGFINPTTGSASGSEGASSFYSAFPCSSSNSISHSTKLHSLYTSGVFHDSAWVDWFPSDTATTGEMIDSVTFYVQFIMTDTSNCHTATGDTTIPYVDIYGSGQSFTYIRIHGLVSNVFTNVNINTYPNPTTNELHIAMSGAQTGGYNVNVYDLNGRSIDKEMVEVNSGNYTIMLHTENWPMGMYMVQLEKDGASHTMMVVKE